MKPCAESVSEKQDKQLRKISLAAVLEKRRLDQALNAKEFAVCAGGILLHGAKLVSFTGLSCVSWCGFLARFRPVAHRTKRATV